jgi:hypothetical protein
MAHSRRCWEQPARNVDSYRERFTMLPPPPDRPIEDPRASQGYFSWIGDLSFDDVDEDATPTIELRDPTDVDGSHWWEDDAEGSRLTQPSPVPNFH